MCTALYILCRSKCYVCIIYIYIRYICYGMCVLEQKLVDWHLTSPSSQCAGKTWIPRWGFHSWQFFLGLFQKIWERHGTIAPSCFGGKSLRSSHCKAFFQIRKNICKFQDARPRSWLWDAITLPHLSAPGNLSFVSFVSFVTFAIGYHWVLERSDYSWFPSK